MRAGVGAEGNDGPRRESPASPTLDGRRPNPVRQETDAILSYYQSADAGRDVSPSPLQQNGLGHSDWSRTPSGSGTEPGPRSFSTTSASTSSSPTSEYPESTRTNPHPLQPRAASPSASSSTTGALRRTSIPSQGGTDRRRLAIMEMDTSRPSAQSRAEQTADRGVRSSGSGGVPPSSFHPRRGHDLRLGGLALVAPPDASPQSYTAMTPPKAAPVPKLQPSISAGPPVSSGHSRTSSDATRALSKGRGHVPRKSSREVAVVGTADFPGVPSVSQQHSKASPTIESLKPPLFQIPQSRSPSPGASEISDSCSTNRGRQRKDALSPGVSPITEVKEVSTPVRTPNIGESKRISDRVAGPVVINLCPESPSPSPAYSSPSSSTPDTMSPSTNPSSPLTPSTAPTSPAMSPYLFYQPGLHATAGPLPPPPQAVFNIDPKAPPPPRPPRYSPIRKKGELDAIKEALQLPPHVVAALKAKPSAPPTERRGVSSTVSPSPQQSPTIAPATITSPKGRQLSLSSRESTKSDTKPRHVREGAFPPSRLGTRDSDTLASSSEDVATTLPPLDSMDDLVASIGLAIDDMGIMSSSDVPPPTIVEPPRGNEGQSRGKGLEIRRSEDRRLSFSPNPSPERPHVAPVSFPPRSEESVEQSWVDPDKTITLSEEKVPPVPEKNDIPRLDTKSLKGALNIKRFSALPRTPSLMSLNRLSSGTKRSSRTPSPSVAYPVPRSKPPVRKTKSINPPAMYFADITVKRTSLERSIGYAHKINELYNHDCGLGDWIAETRYKSLHPHSSTKRPSATGGPRVPSTFSPSMAPRHFSQSSTDSGVTFPRRADAYSATDLSARTAGDASPPNAPPPLPYPALAAAPRSGPSRASTMIATSSSSSTRSVASPSSSAKSPGGFFASLGRKTSLKEKPLTPPSPAKTLSKSPPRNVNEHSSPRPANLAPIAPTVPGGPRAPPNRMQRSQTIIITSQNSMNGASPQRSSTMARRPSLFDGRGSAHQQLLNTMSDAEFSRQVDKLAALLPKADRKVLAIYLRRAGQDILAIGQYLEDEKNGTLRYE